MAFGKHGVCAYSNKVNKRKRSKKNKIRRNKRTKKSTVGKRKYRRRR